MDDGHDQWRTNTSCCLIQLITHKKLTYYNTVMNVFIHTSSHKRPGGKLKLAFRKCCIAFSNVQALKDVLLIYCCSLTALAELAEKLHWSFWFGPIKFSRKIRLSLFSIDGRLNPCKIQKKLMSQF